MKVLVTEKILQILNSLVKDRKAMSPAPKMKAPKPKPKPKPSAPKTSGGAGGSSGGGSKPSGSGGGKPDIPGGGGGGPMDALSSISNAAGDVQRAQQLGGDIKQEKQEADQMKQGEKPLEQQIKECKQNISQVDQQISQTPQGYDTTSLKQQKSQFEQELKQLEEAKKQQDAQIAAKQNQIRKKESAQSAYQNDVRMDAAIDAAAVIPGADVVGIPADLIESARHGLRDKRLANMDSNVDKQVGAAGQKSQQLQQSAQQTDQSAGAVGSVQATPKPAGGGASGKPGAPGSSAQPSTGGASRASGKSGASGGAGASGKSASGGAGGFGGGGPGKKGDAMATMAGVGGTGGFRSPLRMIGIVAAIIFLIIGIPGTVVGSPLSWILGKTVGGFTSGGVQSSAKQGVLGGEGFISKASSNFRATYKRSIAEATGQSIEGKVEEEKRFVGIELKDAYLPNPKRINQDEPLEISARVHGFHPKRPMEATVVCHMKPRNVKDILSWGKMSGADKAGGSVDLEAGYPQSVTPKNIGGDNFDQEITCYPEVYTCGDMAVTITVQADALTTDSVLTNYIIDKTYMDNELKEYAKSKEIELGNAGQVQSALKELHPEIEDYRSISEKGPVNLFMLTEKSSLIGVDDKTQLKLKVAFENALEGFMRTAESVTVIFPKDLRPVAGLCKSWNIQGDRMTLGADFFKKVNFKELKQGTQKLLPSCYFEYTGNKQDLELFPEQVTFLASIKYSYIVQKQYYVDVRTNKGKVCPKVEAKKYSGNIGGAAGTTSTGTKPASLSTKDDAAMIKVMANVEKIAGKPGENLVSVDFFGQSVQVNKIVSQNLQKISTKIRQTCTEGVTYLEKKPPIKGYADIPNPKSPKYKHPLAYGLGVTINPAKNPAGQTGSKVTTDLPACIIQSFKSEGWGWGGDDAPPKDASLFVQASIFATAAQQAAS